MSTSITYEYTTVIIVFIEPLLFFSKHEYNFFIHTYNTHPEYLTHTNDLSHHGWYSFVQKKLKLMYKYFLSGALWSSGLTRYHYYEATPRVDGSHPGPSSFFVGHTRQLETKTFFSRMKTMWTVKTR